MKNEKAKTYEPERKVGLVSFNDLCEAERAGADQAAMANLQQRERVSSEILRLAHQQKEAIDWLARNLKDAQTRWAQCRLEDVQSLRYAATGAGSDVSSSLVKDIVDATAGINALTEVLMMLSK